ncbi:MAG: HAMP domain-containing sensor histidine kinase [Pirellulales bacterium]
MSYAWRVAVAYGLGVALVVAALAWLTAAALRIDRAESAARQKAAFEERVQLALWRLDAAAAPLVAQESARPYFEYEPFFSAIPLSSPQTVGLTPSGGVAPSPLLPGPGQWISLHFQVAPEGKWSSPQAPEGSLRARALQGFVTVDRLALANQRLADLQTFAATELRPRLAAASAPRSQVRQFAQAALAPAGKERAANEFLARVQSAVGNFDLANGRNTIAFQSPELQTDAMTPLWLGTRLLLVRRASVAGRDYLQGCELDAAVLARWLESLQHDLFPHARLEPVSLDTIPSRRLASLPLRFEPGETPPLGARSTSLLIALGLGWGAVALTALAGGVVLAGVVSLSERRAAFVSAVTHELRTPLTTLRLYTELLASGRVVEDDKPRYLQTLSGEAARLGRLVENVLAFARLEGRRTPARANPIPLGQALAHALPRAQELARQAGLELRVEADPAAEEALVRAEPQALEQILSNLVDNACKHAAHPPEQPLQLAVLRDGEVLRLALRDLGAGIPEGMRRRLFRSFSRPAEEAAGGTPGVGLGLALCRGLARHLQGDLRLEASDGPGSCFVLELPITEPMA